MKSTFDGAEHEAIRAVKESLVEDARNYLNGGADEVGEKTKELIGYVLRSDQQEKLKLEIQARILTNSFTRGERQKIREIAWIKPVRSRRR